MPTRHLQKHFWLILCLPSVHTFQQREKEKEKEVRKKEEREKEKGKRKGKRKGRRESKRERVCQASPTHHTHAHHPHTPHAHTKTQNTKHHTQHHMYTHNPTHQTTDRDLESVFVKRSECLEMCTECVFNVNAWICACHSTDRDLETKK